MIGVAHSNFRLSISGTLLDRGAGVAVDDARQPLNLREQRRNVRTSRMLAPALSRDDVRDDGARNVEECGDTGLWDAPLCEVLHLGHLPTLEFGMTVALSACDGSMSSLVRLVDDMGRIDQVHKPVVCRVSVEVRHLHPRRARTDEGRHDESVHRPVAISTFGAR